MVFEIFVASIGLGVCVSLCFFIASHGNPFVALATLGLWVIACEMDRIRQKYE